MQRLETAEQLKSSVKSAQDAAFITNGLAKTSLDGDDEVRFIVQSLDNVFMTECYFKNLESTHSL